MKDLNFDLNFKEHPVPLGSSSAERTFIHTNYSAYASSESEYQKAPFIKD